jgi:hypothetical protein
MEASIGIPTKTTRFSCTIEDEPEPMKADKIIIIKIKRMGPTTINATYISPI